MRPARLTREGICDAARSLLVEDGLHGLSLRTLAARVDATAPALYAHFDNKDALLAALAEEEFGRLNDHIESAAASTTDPLDRVRAQSYAYVEYALANPALFEVMFLFGPPWSAEAVPLASKAFEISALAVEEAIAAGLIRETDPLMASLTIWSAVHGVATFLLARPGLGSEYESALVASVVENIVGGLTRPEGNV